MTATGRKIVAGSVAAGAGVVLAVADADWWVGLVVVAVLGFVGPPWMFGVFPWQREDRP